MVFSRSSNDRCGSLCCSHYGEVRISASGGSPEVTFVDSTTHIEAYTVMHGRTSQPETAWAAIRLADGRRTFGKSDDPALLAHLLEGEHVGEVVQVMSNHQFEPLN